ncbi:MAG TPA: hypothetical protein VMJ66_11005 [Geobacteraceae bacterium]|nr:hypothetical protein [Geobacteraceae bacterium]
MAPRRGAALGILALVLYIIGGISTFGAFWLILFMNGRDLRGWGDGRSIGFLFLCTGLCLSAFGVMLMRIYRNRKGK